MSFYEFKYPLKGFVVSTSGQLNKAATNVYKQGLAWTYTFSFFKEKVALKYQQYSTVPVTPQHCQQLVLSIS